MICYFMNDLLDGCYIYGCDEVFGSRLADVEKSAVMLKEAFPEVEIIVSAMDYTFGNSGVLKHVDTFVPLTPPYGHFPDQIKLARHAGKKVWWYICAGPNRQYANAFIERSGIELRLLMGAMAMKFQTDGFLYYQISFWANNRYPISGGPFTAWNPEIVDNFHGDGTWLYPGPDGIPLPSIRLECFRDGLEDYAYMQLLQKETARVRSECPDADIAWLKEAEAVLAVPEDLVRTLSSFSHDPARLGQWRNNLADLLEKAPRL